MKEWLKSVKWNLILAALAYVVLGVVLLAWPDTTGNVLCTLLGILLLGYGIFQIIGFFTRGDEGWGSGAVYLLAGLCAVALGVFALSSPEKVLAILPVALGAVVVVDRRAAGGGHAALRPCGDVQPLPKRAVGHPHRGRCADLPRHQRSGHRHPRDLLRQACLRGAGRRGGGSH